MLLAVSKITVEKTKLTIRAAVTESQSCFSINLDKTMPPCAIKEPIVKRLNSSEGARAIPGYILRIWKIIIKTGM
jgi:hypothetical protein